MHTQTPLRVGLAAVLLFASVVWADVLSLRDGSTVEGQVIKFGNEYRVKLADGKTRIIPEHQVLSISRSQVSLAGPTFAMARTRAEAVDQPIIAVHIWEKFIEDFPGAPELANAKIELERWRKMHAGQAERIHGKWVGGEERQRILAEVNKLCAEARAQLSNQMLQAIEKYNRALTLYPNCFEANFALGFCYLQMGSAAANGGGNPAELEKAVRSLETAVRLCPHSASALSNLAVGYSFQRRFDQSIMTAYKAVTILDNKQTVENLVNALVRAPQVLKENNARVRKIMPEAVMLARKYGVPAGGTGRFHYLPPEQGIDTASRLDGRPGAIGNGSGFLVSPDGYLITNRHVIEGKNRIFRVRLDDTTEKPAEVVAIDNDSDIALLKIKPDKPLQYLRLSEAQLPKPGAKCMVLGYPIAAELNFNMQVTSGEISAVDPSDEYQVTLVASTTHGNSGGPIVDRDGNVIGILSAGTMAFNATYLRAVSSGQIRKFIDRVKDKHTLLIDWAESANTPFDPEKIAAEARKATVMVLIYPGEGKGGGD